MLPHYDAIVAGPQGCAGRARNGEHSSGAGMTGLESLEWMLLTLSQFATAEAVIVITAPYLRAWKAQVDAAAHGWAPGKFKFARLDIWTTFRHIDTGQTLHVVIGPNARTGRGEMWDDGEAGDVIAARLVAYQNLTGHVYRMTPGVTGCVMVKDLHRDRRQPYWGVNSMPGIMRKTPGMDGQPDILWGRPADAIESLMPWVHAFDIRAARLAAASVAMLPWDRLAHTGACSFDEARAGYWQVNYHEVTGGKDKATGLIPPLFTTRPLKGAQGCIWLTSPIMGELCKQGYNPDVADSYTAPSKRWLRKWAAQMDLARIEAMRDFGEKSRELDMIKQTYRQTAGMFSKSGGSIDRPELYDEICDRQRVTVIGHARRILAATGRAPLTVHTDCLWFASEHEDYQDDPITQHLTMGHGLGQFRWHSTVSMDRYQEGTRK